MLNNNNEPQRKEIPYLPKQLKISRYLKANGKLLTEEQITSAKQSFEQNNNNHIPKSRLIPYTLKKIGDRYYAVVPKKMYICGKGAFGKVKVMQDLESGKFVALKIIKVSTKDKRENQSQQNLIQAEIKSLEDCGISLGHAERNIKKNHDNYYLAMPLAKGDDLYSHLKHRNTFEYLLIALQLCIAYRDQLQTKNLVHRDIKPGNIIRDPITGEIKIIDFGFVVSNQVQAIVCGTEGFMAPEVLEALKNNRQINYDHSIDIFSIGIVLSILLGFITDRFSRNTPFMKNLSGLSGIQLRLVMKILDDMTSDSDKRPDINTCITFFHKLTTTLNRHHEYYKKIGIVDVVAFNQLNPEAKKQKILLLKTMDEIWFADNTENNTFTLLTLRQQLEAAGVNLGSRLINDAANATIAEEINSLCQPAVILQPDDKNYIPQDFIEKLNKKTKDENLKTACLSLLQSPANADFLQAIFASPDGFLDEVFGRTILVTSEKHIQRNFEKYKFNITEIRKLDRACVEYQTDLITKSPANSDAKKYKAMIDLRKELNPKINPIISTSQRIQNFKKQLTLAKPILEQDGDPVTKGFLSKIQVILQQIRYHALPSFFQPAGTRIANKLKQEINFVEQVNNPKPRLF